MTTGLMAGPAARVTLRRPTLPLAELTDQLVAEFGDRLTVEVIADALRRAAVDLHGRHPDGDQPEHIRRLAALRLTERCRRAGAAGSTRSTGPTARAR